MLQTPEGLVQLKHWAIVLKEDQKRGIKVAPKLTNLHFSSNTYAAMSVGLAFSVKYLRKMPLNCLFNYCT
jgi:hypothetical protein